MRKMTAIGLLLLIFNYCLGQEQNYLLKGTLIFINNNNQPAIGVKVSGQGAISDYSTESGKFRLLYNNNKYGPGMNAGISIGAYDRTGRKIRLIDSGRIKDIRIPKDKDSTIILGICIDGDCPEDRLLKERIKYKSLVSENAEVSERNIKYDSLVRSFRCMYENPLRNGYESGLLLNSIDSEYSTKELRLSLDTLSKSCNINAALEILHPEDLESDSKLFKLLTEKNVRYKLENYELAFKLLLLKKDYSRAIFCKEKIIEIQRRFNYSKQKVATSLNNLSLIYQTVGQYKKALENQLAALKLFKSTVDSLNSDVANINLNIGISYYYLGKNQLAITSVNKTLSYYELNKEFKNKDLGNAYEAMTVLYYSMGDKAKAKLFVNKALSLIDSLNIKDKSKSYLNLSEICRLLGDTVNVLNFLGDAIYFQEQIDREHPDMANLLNSYSAIKEQLGNLDIALEYQLKAIEIQKKVFDSIYPLLSVSYHNLARIYSRKKMFRLAAEFEEKAIVISDHYSGNTFINVRLLLETALHYSKEIADKVSENNYTMRIIAYHKNIINAINFSEKDSLVLNNYVSLANIYQQRKLIDSAIYFGQKLVTYCENVLSSDSFYLARAYNNLSGYYLEDLNYFKAVEFCRKSINIKEKSFPDAESLGLSYINLAAIYQKLDSLSYAITYLNKGINIISKSDTANNLIKIAQRNLYANYLDRATIFLKKSDYQNAINDYKAAYSIHTDISLLVMIANCYYYSMKFTNALKYYQTIYELDSTAAYNLLKSNIGLSYAKSGQLKKAYVAFKEFEELHIDEGLSLWNWAVYYALKKNPEDAIICLQKAIEHGYADIKSIKIDNSFKILRNDERFLKIINQSNKRE